MATGQNILQIATVAERPDVVMQNIVTAAATVHGYQVTSAGGNTLILSRRFTPTWAVIVAVIGILFFLIGLLALLVKETETLTVTLTESDGKTRVSISGVATSEMGARLNAVLSGLTPIAV
jgi:hypothetical protein